MQGQHLTLLLVVLGVLAPHGELPPGRQRTRGPCCSMALALGWGHPAGLDTGRP
jgi:hypothetical protein